MPSAQSFERRKHVRIEVETAERVEVAGNRARIPRHVEMSKGLSKRQCADFLVRPIRLPVMGDVSFFPIFPEGTHVDVGSAAVAENRAKGIIRALPYVDERAKDVEGKKHHRAIRLLRTSDSP